MSVISNMTYYDKLVDWSVGGVDFNVLDLGGLDCLYHVSMTRRIIEILGGNLIGKSIFTPLILLYV